MNDNIIATTGDWKILSEEYHENKYRLYGHGSGMSYLDLDDLADLAMALDLAIAKITAAATQEGGER